MSRFELAFTGHPPPGLGAGSFTDAALTAGTPTEFGMLFDRYAAQLWAYAAHRVGVHAADDIVSETFLVAYRRRRDFDPASPSARPWLYGIATNLAHRRRHAEAIALRATTDWTGVEPGVPDPAERVAERADAQALVRTMAGALAQLSRRHRDVLYLLAAGLDRDEIAKAIGVSPGTVRSRLHRARTHLRELLAGQHQLLPTDPAPRRGDHR